MRTVQMTLEEDLVRAVDMAARKLKTARSAFARQALRAALDRLRLADDEKRHRRGYTQRPVGKGEFDFWEGELDWGSE
ncbi:MAG: ribbon-helix-helix protein, CopG family [Spirochaetes bacterium]|nr:ribbon-helix-helix protein, CopG family [Spirochaetota bacterium]